MPDKDTIRAAAEECTVATLGPLATNRNSADFIESIIRREVERERERCIGLINFYSVSQSTHTVLINRIRKGGE